jgi:uncharacterized membrane protein YhhN
VISPTAAGVLVGVVVVSAVAEIAAEATRRRRAIYMLKPLTTALIVILAAVLPNQVSSVYRTAIIVGLLFSLAGDVFLMLPSDRFVAGLASFLLAHVCYIAAFVSVTTARSVVAGMLLLAWGGFLLGRLWSRLGALRLPVTLYAAVLLAMAWTATGTSAAAGAILFVASDSALALERYDRKHRWGQTVVLSTYFIAQTLIALSIGAGQ